MWFRKGDRIRLDRLHEAVIYSSVDNNVNTRFDQLHKRFAQLEMKLEEIEKLQRENEMFVAKRLKELEDLIRRTQNDQDGVDRLMFDRLAAIHGELTPVQIKKLCDACRGAGEVTEVEDAPLVVALRKSRR